MTVSPAAVRVCCSRFGEWRLLPCWLGAGPVLAWTPPDGETTCGPAGPDGWSVDGMLLDWPPGLRREEVATLAGVGVTWYTWLEQGRDINVSPQVLDAVARTLLLDAHERDHLFRLADTPDGNGQSECRTLPPAAQILLDQLGPFPAVIRNARYDVLAYNQAYDRLIGPFGDLPFEQRNSLWRMFTVPHCRERTLDWEEGTRRMVAEYRAAMAEHVAEPAWKCLVSRLSKASPEFAELWERHEVASPENLTKRYLHPEVGLLKLNFTHLWLGQRLGTRMTTYTPADALTGERLSELHRHATEAKA